MESINKMLIGLVALALLVCAFITYANKQNIEKLASANTELANVNKEKDTILRNGKDLSLTHPYNACVKLFIDQSNKQGIDCNFEKAKSMCFELVEKKKEK